MRDMDVVHARRGSTGRSVSNGGAGDSSVLTASACPGMRATLSTVGPHVLAGGRWASTGWARWQALTGNCSTTRHGLATDVSERALAWARRLPQGPRAYAAA